MKSRTKQTRSCRTRKKYETKEDAQKRANGLYKRKVYLKPYYCTLCKGYHLTNVNYIRRLQIVFTEAGMKF